MYQAHIMNGESMQAADFRTVFEAARLAVRYNARHYGKMCKGVVYGKYGNAICTVIAYDGAFAVYSNRTI